MAVTINGDGTITGLSAGGLPANSVTEATIADGAITAAKIAADTIVAADIAAGAVGASELADDAVDTAAIVDANVTLAKVENVTSGQIIVGNGSNRPTAVAVSGDVTLANTGAVTIATGAVEHAMLAGDAVDGDNIADDSINSEHYVDGSIDNAHIANDAVTGAKLNPALVQGDIIYADGTDTIERLAKGTAGQYLKMNSGATAPEWATLSVSSDSITEGNTTVETVDSGTGYVTVTVDGTEEGRWTPDGLCFHGDTAHANALYDYEEGTWQPLNQSDQNIQDSATDKGQYIKIGKFCWVNCTLNTGPTGGNHPAAQATQVIGLPYTFVNTISNGCTWATASKQNGNSSVGHAPGVLQGNGSAALFIGGIGAQYWGGFTASYAVNE